MGKVNFFWNCRVRLAQCNEQKRLADDPLNEDLVVNKKTHLQQRISREVWLHCDSSDIYRFIYKVRPSFTDTIVHLWNSLSFQGFSNRRFVVEHGGLQNPGNVFLLTIPSLDTLIMFCPLMLFLLRIFCPSNSFPCSAIPSFGLDLQTSSQATEPGRIIAQ